MKKINFTALAILGVGIFAVSMVYWTVDTAISNPVQMENKYMNDYHYVDRNYIQIKEDEKTFDDNYNFEVVTKNFRVGDNKTVFSLTNKNNEVINNAKVSFILTTPYTNKLNKDYKTSFQNNNYSANVNFSKKGRWIFVLKITIGDLTIFKHIEKYVK